MAKKEVKTDLWVARQLDDSKIKYDAQGSDVKEINDALQSASKRGTGNAGYPEYVAVVKDFVIVIEDNNPDLKFVVPKEGSNWFVDAMCVLKTAQHKEEAEAWINFIASTESSLANMDYIGYASPNLEALEGYPTYYEETYGEPLDEERYEIMAAPDDVLARCELYTNLPADTLTLYNDLWTELGI